MSRQLASAFSRTAVVALVILATGCASSSLMVSQPPAKRVVFSSLHIVPGDSTVTIDPQIAQAFEAELRQDLYAGEKRFVDGDQLTVSYRFVQMNEGSRAARYFAGAFGAGKGTMTVEISYRSKDGVEISKINVGGEISVGVFGGSFDSAVKKAAEEAASYTVNNFHA
jgi:hypothetical protein